MSLRHDPIFRVWRQMIHRCTADFGDDFKNYKGRGIKVCDRWLASFETFKSDMGIRPDGMMIERKDNNAGYSPQNCIWATRYEQNKNRRNVIMLTLNGETLCAHEWDVRFGFTDDTVARRIRRGWKLERIFSPIVMKNKK